MADPKSVLYVSDMIQAMELEAATHELLMLAGVVQGDDTWTISSSNQLSAEEPAPLAELARVRPAELLTSVRDFLRETAEGPCPDCSPTGGPMGPITQGFTMAVAAL